MGEWNQRRKEDGDEPDISLTQSLQHCSLGSVTGTNEALIELVERVRRASEKAGLYLNEGNKKVMTTGDIGEVTVDG